MVAVGADGASRKTYFGHVNKSRVIVTLTKTL
jgi:hypothetical protein